MNEALIQLQAICYNYKQKQVLTNINFSLSPNQITTIIGPNGAGKTTLVKIILGLLQPTQGTVERASHLRIGYMPQKLHIDPTLPITLGRFLSLVNTEQRSRQQALNEVGLEGKKDWPLQGLSGGELQRALLARAILRKPNLLVLDEPVQGVDVAGQQSLYKLIGQLRERLHCAVLMISHDLHLVMSATDEVICLNNHVCCHGHPDQVTQNPAFIALFGSKTTTYTHHHDHDHDSFGGNSHSEENGVGITPNSGDPQGSKPHD